MTDRKDYRVEMRVKNNILYEAIMDAGYDSIAQFCRAHDLNANDVGPLINFKKTPINEDGQFCIGAQRVALALHYLPEDLFPEQHLHQALKKNVVTMSMSLDEIKTLPTSAVAALEYDNSPEASMASADLKKVLTTALDDLRPRDKYVLERHWGLDGEEPETLEQIGEHLNIHRERVRQIESRAIKVLQHPNRAEMLKVELRDD